jgi:hypothetical protein
MNRKLYAILLLIFINTFTIAAPPDKEEMRKKIIEMIGDSPMAKELNTPVKIALDDKGCVSITDSGNYFFQYVIEGPEACTEPNIVIDKNVTIPPSVTKAVIVTHGWIDKATDDWPSDTAHAFRDKTDPNEWMCAYFGWKGGAAVINPADAVKYSRDIAGLRLAISFLTLWKSMNIESRPTHVHLIAHSAGTWAATTAARDIFERTGASIHLTLHDAYIPLLWDPDPLGDFGQPDNPAKSGHYVEHYYTGDITADVTQENLKKAHNIDLSIIDGVIKEHEFPYRWYIATITGKYRKTDHEKNTPVVTAYKGLDYGFARSLEAGPGNYKKSLKLKTNNKAVKIGKKKKKSLLDISSWLD